MIALAVVAPATRYFCNRVSHAETPYSGAEKITVELASAPDIEVTLSPTYPGALLIHDATLSAPGLLVRIDAGMLLSNGVAEKWPPATSDLKLTLGATGAAGVGVIPTGGV